VHVARDCGVPSGLRDDQRLLLLEQHVSAGVSLQDGLIFVGNGAFFQYARREIVLPDGCRIGQTPDPSINIIA
jgi:hypothetical protein